jgi:hypothetical protein
MTKDEVKELLDRVLTWPEDDQEKLAQFVREVEQLRAGDDITAEEWAIIEHRAARTDLATDEEVERVFGRYRRLPPPSQDLKALLAVAPLERVDLTRSRDVGHKIDL